MRPGSFFEFEDQSEIVSLEIKEVRKAPVYCAISTTDKGPEEWTLLSGKEWFNVYGKNISFAAHGQPLLQSAMSINAGARLLFKRLVAEDATLANIGIVAKIIMDKVQKTNESGALIYDDGTGVETTSEQKVDGDGNLLYTDATTGAETTTADGNTPIMNTPVMVDGTTATIQYSLKSATGVTSLEAATAAIKGSLTEGEYLLWVISDNGRGKSNKRFKIVPSYRLSKNLNYVLYTFMTVENGETLETIYFNPNPNQIRNNENISLASKINTSSTQLKAYEDENGILSFIAKVAEIAGVTDDTSEIYDYMFCRTRKDRPMKNITVDITNGIDLQSNYGQSLLNGDNGSFGDKPWNLSTDVVNSDGSTTPVLRKLYNEQAIKALNGDFDKVIFDVDRYFIDAFIDANYDPDVKRQIEALSIFREDFMYFRDMGTDLYDLDSIVYSNMDNISTMFAATYCTAYDVIDPYTKKQIPVTVCYDIAQLLIDHLNNGFTLPPAGVRHNFVLNNAIKGTVRFVPSVYPEMDEKAELNDHRINYASYTEDNLVIDTLYTSQEKYTQFSFINNVMAIQDVVKAIRRRCPIIRYSFLDGDDLEKYKVDIQTVLDRYSGKFKTLEMEYVEDPAYIMNKIFYATIKVCFRDFVQTEWFKITALSSATTLS